jgi:starch phosphorylase
VVPVFYGLAADGLPRAWIARMKRSMRLLTPAFSTNRMLWEYAERYYVPATHCFERMAADGYARARQLAAWRSAIRRAWSAVRVEAVEDIRPGTRRVGEGFELAVVVCLGPVDPGDVAVEACFGPLSAAREIQRAKPVALALERSLGGGRHRYVGSIPCQRSGMQGFTVRVRPSHPETCDLMTTGLLTWWRE